MIVDEEVYLEHYGVPGMKWGVRKSNSSRTPEESAARSKKIKNVAKLAAVGGAAAGGAFVAYKMSSGGKKSVKSIAYDEAKMNAGLKKLFDEGVLRDGAPTVSGFDRAGRTVGKIKRTPTKATSEGAKRTLDEIKTGAGQKKLVEIESEMRQRNKEVASQLKDWYNEGSVPVKDRWYPGGN